LLGLADAIPQGLRTGGSPRLAEKVLAVDQTLTNAGIPHAMGGAIAVAYYGEPQMTINIDVNVFASTECLPQIEHVLRPLGVDSAHDAQRLFESDQVRLRWDRNPIHLVFHHDALDQEVPAAIRQVPLAYSTIPIVSPEHLVIRKAMFGRTRDWLDIEAILVAKTPLDLEEIRRWLVRLASSDDPSLARLDEIVLRL
jgi:hypothetical protein